MQSLIELIPKDFEFSGIVALLLIAGLIFSLFFKRAKKIIADDFEFSFKKGLLFLRKGRNFFKATWGSSSVVK